MLDYYDSKRGYTVKPVPGGEQGVRAATITMKVKGAKSGQIAGGAPKTLKGAEDAWQLIQAKSAVMSPRDPQSGAPTGMRLHQDLEVMGRNCKGVPRLWNVLCTNETLTEVLVEFWSQHGAGAGVTQKVYYTIKLTNASVSTFDHVTSEVDGTLFFRARFTFQKIELTWADGGITADDDWERAK